MPSDRPDRYTSVAPHIEALALATSMLERCLAFAALASELLPLRVGRIALAAQPRELAARLGYAGLRLAQVACDLVALLAHRQFLGPAHRLPATLRHLGSRARHFAFFPAVFAIIFTP